MDFIGKALTKMQVTAAESGRAEVGAFRPPEPNGDCLPMAYYFLRGQAEFLGPEQQGPEQQGSEQQGAAQAARRVGAGDLLFVLHGRAHRFADVSGEPAQFLYASIRAEVRGDCPFLSALPPTLLLTTEDRAACPYWQTHLQSLVWESASGGPAAELLTARLWEVVFLLAFRSSLAQSAREAAQGWLAATRDPPLARALGAIQQRPEAEWTVESLAAEAGQSRATFIRQFARALGEPPMTFLYHHRMGVAASLLKQGERSLATVAARVGYGSEAAFSSAFRRHYGIAPGAYRVANAPAPC